MKGVNKIILQRNISKDVFIFYLLYRVNTGQFCTVPQSGLKGAKSSKTSTLPVITKYHYTIIQHTKKWWFLI